MFTENAARGFIEYIEISNQSEDEVNKNDSLPSSLPPLFIALSLSLPHHLDNKITVTLRKAPPNITLHQLNNYFAPSSYVCHRRDPTDRAFFFFFATIAFTIDDRENSPLQQAASSSFSLFLLKCACVSETGKDRQCTLSCFLL